MTEVSLSGAKEAAEEAQRGNLRENDAGIPEALQVDYEDDEVVEVKLHPEVLITFDHIARVSINTYGNDENLLAMEQNLQGAPPYGFDVALTLANPEIVDGVVFTDGADEWPETKILGDPESDTNPYELREDIIKDDEGNPVDTEVKGVGNLPGGNNWDGEPTELDADYIEVTISGRRAQDILGVLDTAGKWFIDNDGNVTEGLFETPPNFGTDEYDSDEDGYPRMTGYPELRVDMVDKKGAIACLFDEDDPNTRSRIETTLFKVTDDGLDALVSLNPEDDAYNLPTYPRGNNRYWDDSDNSGSAGTSASGDQTGTGVDAEPSTSDGMAQAKSAMQDDESVSYEDLTDEGQDFVDDALKAIDAQGYESVSDFGDFEERVVGQEDPLGADADELVTIIDERVDT